MPEGDCLPGMYLGRFHGLIAGAYAEGSVRLVLEPSTEGTGEFTTLVIRDGVVGGEAAGTEYRADIRGELDCAGGRLLTGRLENGMYGSYPFSGTTEARYDPVAHAFLSGTWTATAGSGGSWEAFHVF